MPFCSKFVWRKNDKYEVCVTNCTCSIIFRWAWKSPELEIFYSGPHLGRRWSSASWEMCLETWKHGNPFWESVTKTKYSAWWSDLVAVDPRKPWEPRRPPPSFSFFFETLFRAFDTALISFKWTVFVCVFAASAPFDSSFLSSLVAFLVPAFSIGTNSIEGWLDPAGPLWSSSTLYSYKLLFFTRFLSWKSSSIVYSLSWRE